MLRQEGYHLLVSLVFSVLCLSEQWAKSTIAWHETNTTSSGHFNTIRIEFIPNWIAYSGSGTDYSDRDIYLSGLQIWGGYPSGRRTVHNYDQNGKLDLFKDLGLPDSGVATFGGGLRR